MTDNPVSSTHAPNPVPARESYVPVSVAGGTVGNIQAGAGKSTANKSPSSLTCTALFPPPTSASASIVANVPDIPTEPGPRITPPLVVSNVPSSEYTKNGRPDGPTPTTPLNKPPESYSINASRFCLRNPPAPNAVASNVLTSSNTAKANSYTKLSVSPTTNTISLLDCTNEAFIEFISGYTACLAIYITSFLFNSRS